MIFDASPPPKKKKKKKYLLFVLMYGKFSALHSLLISRLEVRASKHFFFFPDDQHQCLLVHVRSFIFLHFIIIISSSVYHLSH